MKTILEVSPTGKTYWSMPDGVYELVRNLMESPFERAVTQSGRCRGPYVKEVVEIIRKHLPETASIITQHHEAIECRLRGTAPTGFVLVES